MSRLLRPLRLVLALVLLAVIGTAGCVDEPVAAPAPVADRAGDVAFLRAMIPHHQQALELSALVDDRASSPTVRDLAFRIDRDQVEEIGQMQGLLRGWGEDPGATMSMGPMNGMAGPETLARLRTLRGPEFDRLWLATMIAHHDGAIAMARTPLADGTVRTLAENITVTQGVEIDRMRAALAAGG